MTKIQKGILFGIIAGIVDVAPMIAMRLPWDANASAFTMWIISGFLVATSGLKINKVARGIIISYMLSLPIMIIVFATSFKDIIPMVTMVLILGSFLGYSIGD